MSKDSPAAGNWAKPMQPFHFSASLFLLPSKHNPLCYYYVCVVLLFVCDVLADDAAIVVAADVVVPGEKKTELRTWGDPPRPREINGPKGGRAKTPACAKPTTC